MVSLTRGDRGAQATGVYTNRISTLGRLRRLSGPVGAWAEGDCGGKGGEGDAIVERSEGDWRGVILGGLGRVEQGSRTTDRGSNGLRMGFQGRRKGWGWGEKTDVMEVYLLRLPPIA